MACGFDCRPQDFCIVADESVAKGVRRIVAVCGEPATEARRELRELEVGVARVRVRRIVVIAAQSE